MADDCALPDKAREAIEQARLPARQPDRMLGGLGSGAACARCGIVLKRDKMVQGASPAISHPVVP